MNDILSEINSFAKDYSFSHWGYTLLQTPITFDFYLEWINANKHGEMSYLKNHLEQKRNPNLLSAKARSALVFAHPYLPHPKPQNLFKAARVALYANGEDYHFWFKEKLTAVAVRLKEKFPAEEFLCFTDSSPIMERDFARQSGLGWFGKNTCIIHPKQGSLFLLGEILTSVELKPKIDPIPDFCGTCQKCIEICPTQAIAKNRSLDARKCISYLTIESRSLPPEDIRPAIGDWLFGCDLCQTICPWNQKVFKSHLTAEHTSPIQSTNEPLLIEDLRFLLAASGKQIQKKLIGSPLMRAGPFGLRRNAIIVAVNRKLSSLKPEIQKYIGDDKLGELAKWACNIL